jgi:hypothetical protein
MRSRTRSRVVFLLAFMLKDLLVFILCFSELFNVDSSLKRLLNTDLRLVLSVTPSFLSKLYNLVNGRLPHFQAIP